MKRALYCSVAAIAVAAFLAAAPARLSAQTVSIDHDDMAAWSKVLTDRKPAFG